MNTGRQCRDREFIDDPALSRVLSLQPAVVEGLADTPALRGRGFLARWVYPLPISRVGYRRTAAPAVEESIRQRYTNLMTRIWEIDYRQGEFNEQAAHTVKFSRDAERVFQEFENWVEPRFAPGRHGRLGREAVRRVRPTCRLLSRRGSYRVGSRLARRHQRRDGSASHSYLSGVPDFISHARAAFDLLGTNPTLVWARRIWKWIAENGLTEFTKWDCFTAARRGEDSRVDEMQPALDLLERHYLIQPKTTKDRTGRGRKASPVYEVNPHGDGPEPFADNPADSGPPSTPHPKPPSSGHRPEHEKASPTSAHNSQNSSSGSDRGQKLNSAICARGSEGVSNRPIDYILVAAAVGLPAVIAAVEGAGSVGLDCEMTGLDPHDGRIRLLQVATPDRVYLLDLFTLSDPAADLADLFAALGRADIIGHNLQFDLRFLAPLGFTPGRVFDTMLASQLLHAGHRMTNGARLKHSLLEVARRELSKELSKEYQKSDWSKPLSPAQLAYAASDAAILLPLAEALKAKLAEAKSGTTVGVEMAALPGVV